MKYKNYPKEHIHCDFCDSPEYYKAIKDDRYCMGLDIAVCKNCGLVYINPRPTAAMYAKFYTSEYAEYYTHFEEPNEEFIKTQKRFEIANDRIDYINEVLLSHSHTILDIGSFDGSLLHCVHKRFPNLELYGIEPNEKFSQFARDYFGLKNIYNDFFERNQFPDQKFDFVTMSHVLEHCLTPTRIILEVKRILNEDGYFFIGGPNALKDGLTIGEFHIAHAYYFTPITLKRILIKCGFEVSKIDEGGTPYHPREFRLIAKNSMDIEKDYSKICQIFPSDKTPEEIAQYIRESTRKWRVRRRVKKFLKDLLGEERTQKFIDTIKGK